ncbi:hypothetical protein MPER_11224 [Moniliophthora perniciosa FA553]|nr:hypothetical protein MPER_11224 [Moniliophthora perniciosa FA553]
MLIASCPGDIMHLQVMNDHMLVLSSVKRAVNDLLEKRSRTYSGRAFADIAEITGWSFSLASQNYSEMWRKNRRVYQQILSPHAVVELRPAIQQSISIFLKNLLSSPKDFMGHIDAVWGSCVEDHVRD